jgi:hypothetical protein
MSSFLPIGRGVRPTQHSVGWSSGLSFGHALETRDILFSLWRLLDKEDFLGLSGLGSMFEGSNLQ